MVAELARVRFFVAALKSGDSSYPNSYTNVVELRSSS
jgi:hypothetical protein